MYTGVGKGVSDGTDGGAGRGVSVGGALNPFVTALQERLKTRATMIERLLIFMPVNSMSNRGYY